MKKFFLMNEIGEIKISFPEGVRLVIGYSWVRYMGENRSARHPICNKHTVV